MKKEFCELCGEELSDQEIKKEEKICDACEQTNYWASED